MPRSIASLAAIATSLTLLGTSPGASASVITGLTGEFFDMDGGVTSLAQVDARMQAAPDGTWTVSEVDYNGGNGDLERFLGADFASYVGTNADERDTWAVRLRGFLYLNAGENTFTVRSDDGFALRIDDQLIAEFDANRAARNTTVRESLGEGWFPIEVIMWENGGRARLRFHLNGATVAGDQIASAVPLPAGALFLLTGLAAFSRVPRRGRD